ncbi:conjugal transfer protein TraG N-terminal domain-containing protein [Stenoxybacter acetivorans]|uniref:conjugal transfer protein TraG N-terminal domain-containing protein n=1 Tax=Stenoxybacter acetivorans TaxID=422441 RepID=UPI00068C8357|nr:conjugal transfer protein TraG N-terminal domain-containing protein [Stenoxybacter acetivorans]
MTFEYYTFYGNSDAVFWVFQAIATLFGSGMYSSAALAASLFGFMAILAIAAFKLDLRDSFTSVLVIFFLWVGMMTPKVDMVFRGGAWNQNYIGKVSNIPLGIAAMASITSQFGYELTTKMEGIFTTPNDLNYSKTGMLFGAKLYEQLNETRIRDVTLKEDWALFFHQCSFFDIHMYHYYTIEDLRRSTDILALIGKTNRSMFTQVHKVKDGEYMPITRIPKYTGKTEAMACKDAYPILADRTTGLTSNLFFDLARRVFPSVYGSGYTDSMMWSQIAPKLTESLGYMLGNTGLDAYTQIMQSTMINLIRDSAYINGQRNRNAASVQQAYAAAQARQQYITSQKTGWYMASQYLPVIRSAAEAILLGISPIVVLIALLGGIMAFRVLLFYFNALLWIQLWAPVASILNYVMTLSAKFNMSNAISAGNDSNVEMARQIAATNFDGLLMAAVDAQAVAGGMFWLVPAIAGAIAMGGRSLIGSLTGAMTGAKSQGESVGSSVGAGNISTGNVSYNNVSANKFQPNPVYTHQAGVSSVSPVGKTDLNTLTGNSITTLAKDSMGRVGGQSTYSQSELYSEGAKHSRAAAEQQSATASRALTVGDNLAQSWAVNRAVSKGSESATSFGFDAGEQQSFNAITQAAQKLSSQFQGKSTSEIVSMLITKIGANASAGVSASAGMDIGGTGVSGGLKGSVSGSLEKQGNRNQKDSFDVAVSKSADALRQQGHTFTESMNQKMAQSEAIKTAANQGDSYARQASDQYTIAAQAQQASVQSYQQAQNYEQAAAKSENSGASVTVDNAKAIKEYAHAHGMTYDQVQNNPELVAAAAMEAGMAQAQVLKQSAGGYVNSGGLTPNSRPDGTQVSAAAQQNEANIHAMRDAKFGNNAAGEIRSSVGTKTVGVSDDIQQTGARLEQAAQTTIGQTEQNIAAGKQGIETQHAEVQAQVQQQKQIVDNASVMNFMDMKDSATHEPINQGGGGVLGTPAGQLTDIAKHGNDPSAKLQQQLREGKATKATAYDQAQVAFGDVAPPPAPQASRPAGSGEFIFHSRPKE